MAFSEVYTALQTGAVDGQDNPLPTVVNARFYEVTQQIILTSHIVDLNYIAFSKKVWDRFNKEQQSIIERAAIDAATYARNNQLELEQTLSVFLRDQGIRIDAWLARQWMPGRGDQDMRVRSQRFGIDRHKLRARFGT